MSLAVQRMISAVGLALLSPAVAALMLLVWIEMGSPVLFRQRRVGKHGIEFLLYKLRSMHCQANGPQVTSSGDSRVSRLGRFLRRYKLDELPQLWNVLRGEMALIGPRPEVGRYVNMQDPRWVRVLATPPGITDLASLVFRDEEAVLAQADEVESHYLEEVLPQKLALNAFYQSHRTSSTDIRLIWFTLRYSFFPAGFDANRVAAQVIPGAPEISTLRSNVLT